MSIDLPPVLAGLRQFCVRVGKQPFIVHPHTGELTGKWQGNDEPAKDIVWHGEDGWLTLEEALRISKSGRTVRVKFDTLWVDASFDGIGYLNHKESDQTKQIVGGDLDACRDPFTGELSAFAKKFLEDTQPFYTEASPSKCGIRMFYLGHLPDRIDSFDSDGIDDISEKMKAHIIEVKPKVKEKVDQGEMPWNHIELYETDRHLTITGIESKTCEIVNRSSAILLAILPFRKNPTKTPNNTVSPDWINEMDKDSTGKKFPVLTMRDVIDLDAPGWHYEGGQLANDHPILGGTSGHNTLITEDELSYCFMHYSHKPGGDAWVWLAHECGASPWEVPGKGLLRDPIIREKTLAHALKRGLIKPDDVPAYVPTVAFLSIEDVTFLDGVGDKAFRKYSPTKAVASLLKVLKLAKATGGNGKDPIYYYNGQIFVPDGERIINNILNKAAGDLATIKNKKETVTRLHDLLLSYPVTFDHDPFLLGVRNGVVDLRTGEHRPYSPEDLMTDQIQVSFDKDATCPKFVKFLKEVAPNEIDQCTLVDWFAIHSIKLMFPYIMFLNGLGRNGKGIYERVMKRFFGEDAVCGMALEELTLKNNRFAGAELAGKRGQIVSEAGEEQHKGKRKIPTSFMKNATGDGVIDSDRKNKSRVKFKPFHATTIDSNDMPLIDDMSKGWIERFCKADLPYHYVDNPDPANQMERQKDPHLFEKLTTEEELSGILNLLIERTIKISKTMTIAKRPGEEMFAEYQKQSNSISTFLETYCDYDIIPGPGNDVPLNIVYDAYTAWCEMVVSDKVDNKRFGAAIRKMCDNHPPTKVRVGEHQTRIYKGFRFDANRYQEMVDYYRSTHPQTKPVTAPIAPLYSNDIPLKTVTAPIAPLKDENNGIVEKYISIEKRKEQFAKKTPIGADSDSCSIEAADSGDNGAKNNLMEQIPIPTKDLIPVHFRMDYNQFKKDEVASMSGGISRELAGMGIVTIINTKKVEE
jgi:P4 family phage/plasmid primase-like protien